MKKSASILVAGLTAVMFASCSAGDDAGVMPIEDVPETADDTKVFMFKNVAAHEGVSGAYAVKIKTVKGIRYCALPGGRKIGPAETCLRNIRYRHTEARGRKYRSGRYVGKFRFPDGEPQE